MAARKKTTPAALPLPFPEAQPAAVEAPPAVEAAQLVETAPAVVEAPAEPAPRKPRAVHPRKPGSRSSRKAAERERRESRQAAAVMAALGSQITDVPALVAIGVHAIDDAAARGGEELERDTEDGKPGSALLYGVRAARAACPADYWATVGERVAEGIAAVSANMYAVGQLRDDRRLIRERRAAHPSLTDAMDYPRAQALRRFNAISEALDLPVPPEFRFDEDAFLAGPRADPWEAAARDPERRPTRKSRRTTEAQADAAAGKGAP